MEGIFFLLLSAVLFSQSWYVLGMYSDGRMMGVLTGGLGLLSLGTIMFGATISPNLISGGGALELTTALTALVALWSMYGLAVGVHGIWDLEDSAVGFYSGFLSFVSLTIFLLFAISMAERGAFEHGIGIWLAMSIVPLLLTIISAVVFFYLAFHIQALRPVAGWFLLLGSAVIGLVGLWAITSATIM